MAQEVVRGFVLREVPVGDHDRILDILTREHGLITGSARACRRTRSPMLAATQVFALSDFSLSTRQGRIRIDQADLVMSFIDLQSDWTRLVCAAHLSEVFLDCLRDDTEQPDLYPLWAYAMGALIDKEKDPVLMTHTCAMNLMKRAGYEPRLESCVLCDRDMPPHRFSHALCGLVCSRHQEADTWRSSVPLTDGLLSLMRHCVQAPVERLFAYSATEPVVSRFCLIADQYVNERMEKHYQRLDMLRSDDPLLREWVRPGKSQPDSP